jgi:hypothetical protein
MSKGTEESEFVTIARVIDKVKEVYDLELEKLGVDGAYYPVRITVWLTDENFKPLKKLVEIDERECDSEEVNER